MNVDIFNSIQMTYSMDELYEIHVFHLCNTYMYNNLLLTTVFLFVYYLIIDTKINIYLLLKFLKFQKVEKLLIEDHRQPFHHLIPYYSIIKVT